MTNKPTRRRALAMIAAGTTAATAAPAAAAPADAWLALKAEHDQVEAERDRLAAIWDERMRGQHDDVGFGRATLYLSPGRDADAMHITVENLDAVTADDVDGALGWRVRLRAALSAELAARQHEIDTVRARLGLAELDERIRPLAQRAEVLRTELRTLEPTTPGGLAAKLRYLAGEASFLRVMTFQSEQLRRLADAATAIAQA